MTLPRQTWASALVMAFLLCTVASASAAPSARPNLDAWVAQSAAYKPLCDAFSSNVRRVVPPDDQILTKPDVEALLRILWTYPGIIPPAQALYWALLRGDLPEATDEDARIDATCPMALTYLGGMRAIIRSVPQISASDRLRQRVARLALHKAHADLLAPAPILPVMLHATLLDDIAKAGILPRGSVAAAHAAYEKAEARRRAVNEAARGAPSPLIEELRVTEAARLSLLAFVSECIDHEQQQNDSAEAAPVFP
jgi:hypothetical protein